MMRKANVGISKDKWKPPQGYKSAIGRARDAARAKQEPGNKKRIAAVTAEEDDTGSEGTTR